MDRSRNLLVAEVKFSEKGGSIHAYSDDIPGLNIVGTDRDDVLDDVVEGIKFLYKEVKGMTVTVEWVDTPATVFNEHVQPRKNIERFVMKPTFAHA